MNGQVQNREQARQALALWDVAVGVWRFNDQASADLSFPEEHRAKLRSISISAAIASIEAMGGFAKGFNGPAAIALGWA